MVEAGLPNSSLKGRLPWSTSTQMLQSKISFLRPLLDWACCNCPPAWRVWTIKSMGAELSPPRAIKPCESSPPLPTSPLDCFPPLRSKGAGRPSQCCHRGATVAGSRPRASQPSVTFSASDTATTPLHSASVFTAPSVWGVGRAGSVTGAEGAYGPAAPFTPLAHPPAPLPLAVGGRGGRWAGARGQANPHGRPQPAPPPGREGVGVQTAAAEGGWDREWGESCKAGQGRGVGRAMAVLQGLSETNVFFCKNLWEQEGSREPSPAPDCLQRKIETLRAHPTEIFNFMVVSGTPRLGRCS